MKNFTKIAIIALTIITLTACGSTNPNIIAEGAGFWWGLWDGFTCIFAFIGSLFGGDFNIYEVNNNGNWYNFGFLLGSGILLGGGSSTTSRH